MGKRMPEGVHGPGRAQQQGAVKLAAAEQTDEPGAERLGHLQGGQHVVAAHEPGHRRPLQPADDSG